MLYLNHIVVGLDLNLYLDDVTRGAVEISWHFLSIHKNFPFDAFLFDPTRQRI